MKDDVIESKLIDMGLAIRTLEIEFRNTIDNKHNEALAIARAIDIRFKWTSLIIGMIGALGIIIGIVSLFNHK